MKELQNASVKQKIAAVFFVMGIGAAFMGIVGGLGSTFERFFNVPTKQAMPLAIIATPVVIFVLYALFAVILDRFLEPLSERKYQQKIAKSPE